METPFKNPLDFLDGIQWPVPFSKEDLEKTPEAVRAYIPWLHQRINAQNQRLLGRLIDKPVKVKITVIHHVDLSELRNQFIKNADIVNLGIGYRNKRGNIAPQIEQRMEFDAAFG